MEIRRAGSSDVPELARLWLEFGTYYAQLDPERFKTPGTDGLEEWIEAGLQRSSERWLVAEIDGRIAGYAVGQVIEPHPNADLKMLTDARATRLGINVVHTSETYRRTGVATALIRALEDWGRREGAELVLAETDSESPVAIPFWGSRGWIRANVGAVPQEALDDDRDGAAVGAPRGPRHVGRTLRAEKCDHRGDFLRLGEAAERSSCTDPL